MKEELIKILTDIGHYYNTEKIFKKYHPIQFNIITNHLSNFQDMIFNERLYCLLNDFDNRPICKITGKHLKFINLQKGYEQYATGVKSKDLKIVTEGKISEEELNYLKQNSNIITKNVGSFQRKQFELYSKILFNTQFLPGKATVSERIYCLINNITEFYLDKTYVNINKGYVNKGKDKGKRNKNYKLEYLRYAALVGSNDVARGKRIYEAELRRKQLNQSLYEPNKIEGIDYIVCPILGTRMIIIKRNYVEDILGLDWNKFLSDYPNIKLQASSRSKNISAGLKEINQETGLTKHELSVVKSKETLSTVNEDGLTGYELIGMKTRKTHMHNIDENGLNGYQRIASVARPKQFETMAKNGKAIDPNKRYEWEAYRWFCIWWSNQFKSAVLGDRKTGRAGTKNAYHVDHKFTIFDGFRNKISPFLIGGISNLMTIPWEENIEKNRTSDIPTKILFERSGYSEEQSSKEFEIIWKIIEEMRDYGSPRASSVILQEYNRRADEPKLYQKHKI